MGSKPRAARTPEDRLAAGQFGLISSTQVGQCGLSHSALRYRIRVGGPWQRVLPGVYLTVTGQPTSDQLDMAALLYAGDGAMITGLAALRRYRVSAPASRIVQVLTPVQRHHMSCAFVAVQRTRRMPRRFGALGPIRYALPARAVVDADRLIRGLGDMRAVVSAVVQQEHCTVADLRAELASGRPRGSARLRAILDEVGDGIRSAAEADFRALVRRAGLPAPMFNPRLFLGQDLLAVPDAWWPHASLAAEVDSREWHLSAGAWERTMRRHARMTSAGLLVLHFSPRQIRDEPDDVVRALSAALRAGRPARGIRAVPPAS